MWRIILFMKRKIVRLNGIINMVCYIGNYVLKDDFFLVYCFRENLFISDEISLWFYISRLFRYLEDNNLGFFWLGF